jgi:hypothetical protein
VHAELRARDVRVDKKRVERSGHTVLAERLSAEANALREPWWAQSVPVLLVGPERDRALGEWLRSR